MEICKQMSGAAFHSNFMNTKIWILYHSHMSWSILFFFQLLKDEKKYSVLKDCTKTDSVADLTQDP